jgi:Nif11 domain
MEVVPMKSDSPLDFLAKAQKDPKLSARVLAAVERGGRVTAEEVLEIAREFGYSFSRSEFERDVKRDITRRFNEGDESLAPVAELIRKRPKPKPGPLQSTCARGCLSYTVSWHPTRLP